MWSAVRGLSWSFSPRPSRARRDAGPPAQSRRSWSSGSTKSYCWQGCWQIHPTPSGPSNSSGRNVVWNFTKMSSSVCSGWSAMLAHNGILSSSLSLMAQGFGVIISAESGILARLASMTMLAFLTTSWWDHRQTLADSTLRQRCRRLAQPNLRRAPRRHCEGGVRPHIRVGRVFGMRSSLEFFATAHLFPEDYQPYKNEVHLFPRLLDEKIATLHSVRCSPSLRWKTKLEASRVLATPATKGLGDVLGHQ